MNRSGLGGDGRPACSRRAARRRPASKAPTSSSSTRAPSARRRDEGHRRQGALAPSRREPGASRGADRLRVRERDRAGLRRRFPAVDFFLRPDEEPELVERLGLASAQAAVGSVRRPRHREPRARSRRRTRLRPLSSRAFRSRLPTTSPHPGRMPSRSAPSGASRGSPHGCRSLRVRQDLHVLHRAVQPRTGAKPAVRCRGRRGAGARGSGLPRDHAPRPERQQLWHDLPAEARFAHVAEARRAGRQIDRASRPDLAELIRRSTPPPSGREPRRAAPPLRHLAPVGPLDRLIEAMAEAPAVCAALHSGAVGR